MLKTTQSSNVTLSMKVGVTLLWCLDLILCTLMLLLISGLLTGKGPDELPKALGRPYHDTEFMFGCFALSFAITSFVAVISGGIHGLMSCSGNCRSKACLKVFNIASIVATMTWVGPAVGYACVTCWRWSQPRKAYSLQVDTDTLDTGSWGIIIGCVALLGLCVYLHIKTIQFVKASN
eukprot:669641_1